MSRVKLNANGYRRSYRRNSWGADIVEIIGGYVQLKAAGGDRFKACCPFHDEKTPSFTVSRDKGFYRCFGCKKGGNYFTFLMEQENIPFIEARKMLGERYGIKLPDLQALQQLFQRAPDDEARGGRAVFGREVLRQFLHQLLDGLLVLRAQLGFFRCGRRFPIRVFASHFA